MTSLGTLEIGLKLEREEFDLSLQRLKIDLNTLTREIPKVKINIEASSTSVNNLKRSLESIANTSQQIQNQIKPFKIPVNDQSLTELNKHLESKKTHAQQIQSYFDSLPLRPRIDDSGLTFLNRQIDSVSNKYKDLQRQLTGQRFDIDIEEVHSIKQIVTPEPKLLREATEPQSQRELQALPPGNNSPRLSDVIGFNPVSRLIRPEVSRVNQQALLPQNKTIEVTPIETPKEIAQEIKPIAIKSEEVIPKSFKDLSGSEKQVDWAKKIRQETLDYVLQAFRNSRKYDKLLDSDTFNDVVIKKFNETTSASNIIDKRYSENKKEVLNNLISEFKKPETAEKLNKEIESKPGYVEQKIQERNQKELEIRDRENTYNDLSKIGKPWERGGNKRIYFEPSNLLNNSDISDDSKFFYDSDKGFDSKNLDTELFEACKKAVETLLEKRQQSSRQNRELLHTTTSDTRKQEALIQQINTALDIARKNSTEKFYQADSGDIFIGHERHPELGAIIDIDNKQTATGLKTNPVHEINQDIAKVGYPEQVYKRIKYEDLQQQLKDAQTKLKPVVQPSVGETVVNNQSIIPEVKTPIAPVAVKPEEQVIAKNLTQSIIEAPQEPITEEIIAPKPKRSRKKKVTENIELSNNIKNLQHDSTEQSSLNNLSNQELRNYVLFDDENEEDKSFYDEIFTNSTPSIKPSRSTKKSSKKSINTNINKENNEDLLEGLNLETSETNEIPDYEKLTQAFPKQYLDILKFANDGKLPTSKYIPVVNDRVINNDSIAEYREDSNAIGIRPETLNNFKNNQLNPKETKTLFHEIQHAKDNDFGSLDGLFLSKISNDGIYKGATPISDYELYDQKSVLHPLTLDKFSEQYPVKNRIREINAEFNGRRNASQYLLQKDLGVNSENIKNSPQSQTLNKLYDQFNLINDNAKTLPIPLNNNYLSIPSKLDIASKELKSPLLQQGTQDKSVAIDAYNKLDEINKILNVASKDLDIATKDLDFINAVVNKVKTLELTINDADKLHSVNQSLPEGARDKYTDQSINELQENLSKLKTELSQITDNIKLPSQLNENEYSPEHFALKHLASDEQFQEIQNEIQRIQKSHDYSIDRHLQRQKEFEAYTNQSVISPELSITAPDIGQNIESSIPEIAQKATKKIKSTSLEPVGQDLIKGLEEGMLSQAGSLTATSQELGIIPEQVIRKVTETHSPSAVFRRVGSDLMLGFAEGLRGGIGDIIKVFGTIKFAELITQPFVFAIQNIAFGFNTLISDSYKLAESLERVKIQLEDVDGSSSKAKDSFSNFSQSALKFGGNAQDISRAYVGFKQATLNTPLEGQAGDIVTQLNQAFTAKQIANPERSRIYEYINEIVSSGKLEEEKISKELPRALPGALGIAARSQGLNQTQFLQQSRAGGIDTEKFIAQFAKQAQVESQGNLDSALDSPVVKLQQFQARVESLQESLGKGLLNSVGLVVAPLNTLFDVVAKNSTVFEALALVVGGQLALSFASSIPLVAGLQSAFAGLTLNTFIAGIQQITALNVGQIFASMAAGAAGLVTALAPLAGTLAIAYVGIKAFELGKQFFFDFDEGIKKSLEDTQKLVAELNKIPSLKPANQEIDLSAYRAPVTGNYNEDLNRSSARIDGNLTASNVFEAAQNNLRRSFVVPSQIAQDERNLANIRKQTEQADIAITSPDIQRYSNPVYLGKAQKQIGNIRDQESELEAKRAYQLSVGQGDEAQATAKKLEQARRQEQSAIQTAFPELQGLETLKKNLEKNQNFIQDTGIGQDQLPQLQRQLDAVNNAIKNSQDIIKSTSSSWLGLSEAIRQTGNALSNIDFSKQRQLSLIQASTINTQLTGSLGSQGSQLQQLQQSQPVLSNSSQSSQVVLNTQIDKLSQTLNNKAGNGNSTILQDLSSDYRFGKYLKPGQNFLQGVQSGSISSQTITNELETDKANGNKLYIGDKRATLELAKQIIDAQTAQIASNQAIKQNELQILQLQIDINKAAKLRLDSLVQSLADFRLAQADIQRSQAVTFLNRQQAIGSIGTLGVQQQTAQINATDATSKLSALNDELKGLGNNLDKYDTKTLDKFKELLGVSQGTDLKDYLQKATPGVIDSRLANLSPQQRGALETGFPNLQALVETAKSYSGTAQQTRQGAESQSDSLARLQEARVSAQDTITSLLRNVRGVQESFQDFGRSLNKQLLDAQNSLKEAQGQLAANQLKVNLQGLLTPGRSGFFRELSGIIDEYVNQINQITSQENRTQSDKLSVQDQTIALSRQIRGLEEQRYDINRELVKTLVGTASLINGQSDIQVKTWQAITGKISGAAIYADKIVDVFKGMAEKLQSGVSGVKEPRVANVVNSQLPLLATPKVTPEQTFNTSFLEDSVKSKPKPTLIINPDTYSDNAKVNISQKETQGKKTVLQGYKVRGNQVVTARGSLSDVEDQILPPASEIKPKPIQVVKPKPVTPILDTREYLSPVPVLQNPVKPAIVEPDYGLGQFKDGRLTPGIEDKPLGSIQEKSLVAPVASSQDIKQFSNTVNNIDKISNQTIDTRLQTEALDKQIAQQNFINNLENLRLNTVQKRIELERQIRNTGLGVDDALQRAKGYLTYQEQINKSAKDITQEYKSQAEAIADQITQLQREKDINTDTAKEYQKRLEDVNLTTEAREKYNQLIQEGNLRNQQIDQVVPQLQRQQQAITAITPYAAAKAKGQQELDTTIQSQQGISGIKIGLLNAQASQGDPFGKLGTEAALLQTKLENLARSKDAEQLIQNLGGEAVIGAAKVKELRDAVDETNKIALKNAGVSGNKFASGFEQGFEQIFTGLIDHSQNILDILSSGIKTIFSGLIQDVSKQLSKALTDFVFGTEQAVGSANDNRGGVDPRQLLSKYVTGQQNIAQQFGTYNQEFDGVQANQFTGNSIPAPQYQSPIIHPEPTQVSYQNVPAVPKLLPSPIENTSVDVASSMVALNEQTVLLTQSFASLNSSLNLSSAGGLGGQKQGIFSQAIPGLTGQHPSFGQQSLGGFSGISDVGNIFNTGANAATDVASTSADLFSGGFDLFAGLFNKGGLVQNYAIGGMVDHAALGAQAMEALNREQAATGRQPVLAALTPGEYVVPLHEVPAYMAAKQAGLLTKNYYNGGKVTHEVENFNSGGLVNYKVENFSEGGVVKNIQSYFQGGNVSSESSFIQEGTKRTVENHFKGGIVENILNYGDGGLVRNIVNAPSNINNIQTGALGINPVFDVKPYLQSPQANNLVVRNFNQSGAATPNTYATSVNPVSNGSQQTVINNNWNVNYTPGSQDSLSDSQIQARNQAQLERSLNRFGK